MRDNSVQTTGTIPENPKIKVHLRGLGVVCFDNNDNRSETGFLDIPGHPTKFLIRDTDGNTIESGIFDGKKLKIVSEGKSSVEVYKNGENDVKNFDKLLDLSEIYGEINLNAGAKFSSKIYIQDAVFFADPECPPSKVFSYEASDNQERPTSQEISLSRALFAYTKSDQVSLYLDDKNIKLDNDKSYSICIWSQCPLTEENEESDFQHYYDILQNQTKPQQNLKYVSGGNTWVSSLCNAEKKFKKLAGKVEKLITAASSDKEQMDVNEIKRITFDMQHLADILCVPEPCLLVTFANKSRSIPE